MECPICKGSGKTACHTNTGPDSSKHRWQQLQCRFCNGTGAADPEKVVARMQEIIDSQVRFIIDLGSTTSCDTTQSKIDIYKLVNIEKVLRMKGFDESTVEVVRYSHPDWDQELVLGVDCNHQLAAIETLSDGSDPDLLELKRARMKLSEYQALREFSG